MTSLFTMPPAAVATPKVRSLQALSAGLALAVALLSVVGVAAPTAHADAADTSNFVGALFVQEYHLRIRPSCDRRRS